MTLSSAPRSLMARSSTFPTYLVPSIPFRSSRRSRNRKDPSPTTTTTTSAPSTTPQDTSTSTSSAAVAPPARPRSPYLSGHTSYLRCARCSTDVCLSSQIISKGFTGRHGRAYLVCPATASEAGAGISTSTGTGTGTTGISISTSTAGTGTGTGGIPPAGTLANTLTHKAVPRQLVTGAHTVSDISCAVCGAVLGWKYVGAEDEAQRYKVGKFILETRKVRAAGFWEEEEDDGDDDENLEEEDDDDEEGLGVSRPPSFGDRAGVEVRMEAVEGGHVAVTSSSSGSRRPTTIAAGTSSNDSHPLGPTRPKPRGHASTSTPGGLVDLSSSNSSSRDKARYNNISAGNTTDEILFDSQDEDECEDLFAGVWSPALAATRRRRRRFGRAD